MKGMSSGLPPGLLHQQYSRAAMYLSHEAYIRGHFAGLQAISAIEFGGSNGYIRSVFQRVNPNVDYHVAPNAPEVDIQNLSLFSDGSYDVVVLDEILEHVENPWRAIEEVRRVLRPGGTLLTSSPLMIAVHKVPEDYWRFTEAGLGVLLDNFRDVTVDSWGNKAAVTYLMNGMMVTVEAAISDGKFDLTNDKKYAVDVWGYARK